MIILWDLQKAAMAPPQSFIPEITALKIFNEDSDCRPMVFSGDLEGNICKRIPPSMITDSNKWRGHTGRVWDIELTPCGSILVTVGVETSAETRNTKGSIAIWELENFRCLARFASTSEVQASAVSGSGKYLVTATADRKISLWHLEKVLKQCSFEQTCLSEFLTPSVIRSLQFLGENKIFSAGGDGVIRSWKITDDGVLAEDISMNHGLLSEAHVKEGPQQYGAYALALSPCNKFLACSGRGLHRAITIWSIEKPELPMNVLVTKKLESTKGVHSIIFTNDGEHLLSANWEGSIQLWDWRESGGAIIFCQPEQHLSALVPAKSINRFVGATAMGDVYGMHLFTKFT
jgi:WD40 repeat protein